jgi:hypothetical protein
MIKKFPAFMKPKASSTCSQKHYITLYSELEGSSLQFQTLLLLGPFKYYSIIYV